MGATFAHAKPKAIAIATVDVGAGSNVGNETEIAKARDRVEVYVEGAALRTVRVTWTAGVVSRTLAPQSKQRLLARIETTAVEDPVLGLGSDSTPTGQPQRDRQEGLWLAPGRVLPPIALRDRGRDPVARVRFSAGARPTFVIDRLPEGVVALGFATTGRLGTSLLTRAAGCGNTVGRQRATVSGTFVGGRTFSVQADTEAC